MLYTAVVFELVYPTMGDDDGADAMLSDHPDHVKAMHPGYVRTEQLLDAPCRMAPDGLCLYHCLAAAANYADYVSLPVPLRAVLAEQLRQKSISVLKEHGLSIQAERLGLSGKKGYPDEPEFH